MCIDDWTGHSFNIIPRFWATVELYVKNVSQYCHCTLYVKEYHELLSRLKNFVSSDFRDGNEIPCPAGFYSVGNQTQCTRCDAGYMCPNTDGTGITACVAGKYSEAGAVECTDCPKGYACPLTNSSQTTECQAGFYSTGKQTECTPCPAGKYVF